MLYVYVYVYQDKPSMAVHIYNLSTQKTETGGIKGPRLAGTT